MTRVGITRTASPTFFLTTSEALTIAESDDDLLVTKPDDKSLNARFDDGMVSVTMGGLEYGKRIPKGEFSWFATVNPMPGGVYASVSIVVLKQRDRGFDAPVGIDPASSPEDNADSERLAYVSYASGFSGGAGGTVHLISADNTTDTIPSGSWVMLSRHVPSTGAGVHRWYRVVGVSGDPQRLTTNGSPTVDDTVLGCRIPGGNYQVWRHKVLLDGPDWFFGYEVGGVPRNYADGTFADNTYATIVSDVVSVTERVLKITDL